MSDFSSLLKWSQALSQANPMKINQYTPPQGQGGALDDLSSLLSPWKNGPVQAGQPTTPTPVQPAGTGMNGVSVDGAGGMNGPNISQQPSASAAADKATAAGAPQQQASASGAGGGKNSGQPGSISHAIGSVAKIAAMMG